MRVRVCVCVCVCKSETAAACFSPTKFSHTYSSVREEPVASAVRPRGPLFGRRRRDCYSVDERWLCCTIVSVSLKFAGPGPSARTVLYDQTAVVALTASKNP